MKKKRSSKSSKKKWTLPPGWGQFLVLLPPDLWKLFQEEMIIQDRKKLPLARTIIAAYFREKAMRRALEAAKSPSTEAQVPGSHFGGQAFPPQSATA